MDINGNKIIRGATCTNAAARKKLRMSANRGSVLLNTLTVGICKLKQLKEKREYYSFSRIYYFSQTNKKFYALTNRDIFNFIMK